MSTTRKLSARSVIASTLLGLRPPRLPGSVLVRSGALFGIGEAATRTALHRMAAAGEVTTEDGVYRLAGRLGERSDHFAESRAGAPDGFWDGTWEVVVIRTDRPRPAPERAAVRKAMAVLRLAELREGVWVRPANLDPDRHPAPRAMVRAAGLAMTAIDLEANSADLWDLSYWQRETERLRAEMTHWQPALDGGDTSALAPSFMIDAEILRHMQADPLLPAPLLPTSWPGAALRMEWNRFDLAVKGAWRHWYRSRTTPARTTPAR